MLHRGTAVLAQPAHRTEEMVHTRRELARGGALSFFGAATSAVLGLIVIVVLGRALGDAGAGIVIQTIAVFTIALAVARFGMDSTALWILPRLADSEAHLVRRATWYLVFVSGAVGTVCALVILIVSSIAASRSESPELISAVRATAPLLPVAAMLTTALTATRALGRVAAYVWVGNIALPAMRPIAILGAVGIGAGLTGAAVAWTLPLVPALFLAILVLVALTRRYEPGGALTFWQRRIPQRSLSYALPRVASASLEQLLIWVAVLGVGALAGAAAAGVYGAASRFIAAGLVVDAALRVVVAPMFSKYEGRGDHAALTAIHRSATRWLVLFSTPVFVLLAVFAETWLSIVGPSFTQGASVLALMCAGALVTFLAGNIHSVLLMSGRSGLAAINKLCVVIVTIVGIILLTPAFGILGAALAWCAGVILDATLATIEVRYILGIRLSLVAGFYPLTVGIVTVGTPSLLIALTLGYSWGALLLAGGIGAIWFLCWCWLDRGRLQLEDFTERLRRRQLHTARSTQ